MNRKRILNRVYLPILCLITVLSVGFRTAATLYDYNPKIGYFDEKWLINTASILAVCGAVLLFTYAFLGNKTEKLIATFTTPATYVPSVIIITALIFFAVKTYERIKDFEFNLPSGAPAGEAITHITQNLSVYVSAAIVPLALFSAMYFILNATVAERYSVARAAFGVCAVLFFALYASFLYFDATLAINSLNKIVDQMAFIFAALFFLYEIRISLARECWHLYVAFGLIAALLCAYSSVPALVIFFARDVALSHSIEENLLMLCVFLFISSRLVLASKLNPDRESEFVTAMREHADERNRYIVEKEEIERRAYIELYNRLSEIEELPEDANESELFGVQSDEESIPAEPTEITIDSEPEELESAESTSEAVPADTEPAEEAAEAVPADAEPVEEAAEAEPADAEPVEEAAEAVPADAEPAEEAAEVVPAGTEPAEEAAEVVPAGTEPAEEAAEAESADTPENNEETTENEPFGEDASAADNTTEG